MLNIFTNTQNFMKNVQTHIFSTQKLEDDSNLTFPIYIITFFLEISVLLS